MVTLGDESNFYDPRGQVDSPTVNDNAVLAAEGTLEWSRLRSAITSSRRQLEGFRKERFRFISEYVGKRYSYYGARDKVPTNMVAMLVSIHRRLLASGLPRVMCSSDYGETKAQAYDLQIGLNILLEEMDFDLEQQDCIVDALFSVGIMKIGESPYGMLDMEGENVPVGEPFACVVDLDDFVIDMSARSFRKCGFIGDRVRVAKDDLIASGRFAGHEDRMVAMDNRYYDETGQELVERIDTGSDYMHEGARDHTEYWEIFRPEFQDVVVFLCDDQGLPTSAPVEHRDWDGPPSYHGSVGPYHPLGFDPVPNNPLPVSPVALVFDLHDLSNVMYRKISRQGLRQKTVTGVRTGKSDDGNNIISANDGEMIRLDDPRNVNEVNLGGFDQNNMLLFANTKQLFSYYSGNLDVMGGLSPQADTLGQEQILQGSSSRKLSDMQETVVTWTKGCTRAVAWWYWNNPIIETTGTKSIPGTDVTLPFTHGPENRIGEIERFLIDIEPYSMVHRTPQGKLQDLFGIYERVVLPMLPMLGDFGVGFDFKQFLELIAQYSDLPELRDIMMMLPREVTPAAVGQGGAGTGHRPQSSPTTRRTYERINRSAGSMKSPEEQMMGKLMGQSQNGAAGGGMQGGY